ncbi:MAG: cytochrome c [Novosphingobium sp.]
MTPAVSASTPPVDQAAATGLAFAQAHCSQCHAVVPLRISPNPEAPPFETVVNVPGLTDVTLKTFLRDSHNFPEIMNFDIDPEQIDALAAYMLTLRNSD